MMQHVFNEKLWVSENKYQSPEVINELIEIIGHNFYCVILTLNSGLQCWLMRLETYLIRNSLLSV